jgi:hypothetical protein
VYFIRVALVGMLLVAPALAAAQPRYPSRGPYGRYVLPRSDLRIDVTPKEAAVYVDGYFAGVVDDFDGVFQRLHVTPGPHEIVIYLEGYRSIRERLYLSPDHTRKITGEMARLAAGEQNEPVPTPSPDEPQAPDREPARRRIPPRPPAG